MSETNTKIATQPMFPDEAFTNKMYVLDYEEQQVQLPIYRFERDGLVIESTSKMLPYGKTVLVGEYGLVGMMALLNNARNNIELKAPGKMVILGVGNEVPSYFKIGDHIIPKNRENYMMRFMFDPANHFSFEMLLQQVNKDKDIVAAVAITGNKNKSRVGLRMDDTVIDPTTIENVNKKEHDFR